MTTNFASVTVLNDGQFRYPVDTDRLFAWETENGPITAQNYEQFCDDVPCNLPGVIPGSQEMIDVCEALRETGSPFRYL